MGTVSSLSTAPTHTQQLLTVTGSSSSEDPTDRWILPVAMSQLPCKEQQQHLGNPEYPTPGTPKGDTCISRLEREHQPSPPCCEITPSCRVKTHRIKTSEQTIPKLEQPFTVDAVPRATDTHQGLPAFATAPPPPPLPQLLEARFLELVTRSLLTSKLSCSTLYKLCGASRRKVNIPSLLHSARAADLRPFCA